MNKKLIIFGGEGYIGRVVQNDLSKLGYKCFSYDNLIYTNNKKKYVKKVKKRNFIFANIKNLKLLKKKIDTFDYVLILSGLVGDPITKKYPSISKKINETYTKRLIDLCLKSNIEKLIFVSTCSNYGISKNNQIVNEKSKLKPISLYSKSKVKIEKYLLKRKKSSDKICTILRFATAYGLSPRMRFDLTVNEFVKTLYDKKKLEVYDENTWRPYCHVKDFSRIINLIFKSKSKHTNFKVFNAGSSDNNFTKKMIVQKMKKYFKNPKIIFLRNSKDMRDYHVNFDKIKKLGFRKSWSIDKGIKEIIFYLKNKKRFNYQTGNYKIYR
jgi:nucleoside-diphosphate-sugar epimerase